MHQSHRYVLSLYGSSKSAQVITSILSLTTVVAFLTLNDFNLDFVYIFTKLFTFTINLFQICTKILLAIGAKIEAHPV